MPRPAKSARLYLHPKRRVWIVRDRGVFKSTGRGEADHQGAEDALADYLGAKHRPVSDHRPAQVTVSDVLIFYGRNVAPGHRAAATTGYAIDRLDEFWADKKLSEVKRSTCQAYVDHRTSHSRPQAKSDAAKQRKVSAETARRELGVLRAAINAYHAEHNLDSVPTVTLPPASAPRERWLTRKEVAMMLGACRQHPDRDAGRAMARFILISVYTGTRSAAVRSLSWLPSPTGGWVDVERQVMHRRAAGQTDTTKKRPPLRIPVRLLGHLRRWKKADGKRGRVRVIHYAGAGVQRQRRAWAWIRKEAGLGPEVVPHICRHTAATWMMQRGIAPWDAAGWLGMTPETLWRVYGHHHPDFQKEIAERFGR